MWRHENRDAVLSIESGSEFSSRDAASNNKTCLAGSKCQIKGWRPTYPHLPQATPTQICGRMQQHPICCVRLAMHATVG